MPGDVARVYEFVNSIDHRSFLYQGQRNVGGDELHDVKALRAWLVARDLLPRRAVVTAGDLTVARALRGALREGISAHGTDPIAGEPAMARASSRFLLVAGVDEQGVLGLRPCAAGVRGALSVVLIDAVTASMSGRWQRLKMCGAPDCRWVFFDASKPGTARWCETEICGNRVKKSNQRARRRASV